MSESKLKKSKKKTIRNRTLGSTTESRGDRRYNTQKSLTIGDFFGCFAVNKDLGEKIER